MSQAAPTPDRPATRVGTLGTLALVARDIKLAHSVFALPFALMGVFLAGVQQRPWAQRVTILALVVACMVLARTWAMLVNRLADRRFDAANPRTAGRMVASGLLSSARGWRVAIACASAFMLACAAFWALLGNPWPVMLSLPVLAWIALYSYTKRFTLLCHLFLGGALAVSPLAAAIAVDPARLADTPALWWLAGMVLCWVAGFDVVYALQDIAFDRSAGLRSIPARLGWRGSAWVARALHALALGSLVMAWRSDPRLGPLFGVAVGGVALLLIVEHAVLARRGERGLEMAFFTLNGLVSLLLGAAGIADLAWA